MRLRHGDALPGTALSGYRMEEDVTCSRAVGFDKHLTKPVDMASLELAMGRVLAR